MYLASASLHSAPSGLENRLQRAFDLGFRGLAVLPQDHGRRDTQLRLHPQLPPDAMAAVSLDSGWLTSSATQAAGPWPVDEVDHILRRLKALRCATLLVLGGSLRAPAVEENESALLTRLEAGERLDAAEIAEITPPWGENPEWERQLETLASFLYAVKSRAPALKLALQPSPSPFGLLTPGSMALLLKDLGELAPSYWHDCAASELRLAATGEEPGGWLDSFAKHMVGVTLQDYSGGMSKLPPGTGQVDWMLLREYLPRQVLEVLCVAPSYPEGVLLESRTTVADLLSR